MSAMHERWTRRGLLTATAAMGAGALLGLPPQPAFLLRCVGARTGQGKVVWRPGFRK